MRTIKERFDDAGINIPFPQRDLHLAGPIEVVMSGAPARSPANPDRDAVPDARASTYSSQPPVNEPGPATRDHDEDEDAEDATT